MPRLKNKIAIITGAAQGIGLGIAQADTFGEYASHIHLDGCDEQNEWRPSQPSSKNMASTPPAPKKT